MRSFSVFAGHVSAAKQAISREDYNVAKTLLENIVSRQELDIVREQKLLVSAPLDIVSEFCDLFRSAAKRWCTSQDLHHTLNYSVFIEQASAINQSLSQQFATAARSFCRCTFEDFILMLDLWLSESFTHIGNQIWKQSEAQLRMAAREISKVASLSEQTFQDEIGNINEIAFAAARLLNEIPRFLTQQL